MTILLHSWRRSSILLQSINALKLKNFRNQTKLRLVFNQFAKGIARSANLKKQHAAIVKQRYFREFKRSTQLKRAYLAFWANEYRTKSRFNQIKSRCETEAKTKVFEALLSNAKSARKTRHKYQMIQTYFVRRRLKKIFAQWFPAASAVN